MTLPTSNYTMHQLITTLMNRVLQGCLYNEMFELQDGWRCEAKKIGHQTVWIKLRKEGFRDKNFAISLSEVRKREIIEAWERLRG